jgi:hypothetical protein
VPCSWAAYLSVLPARRALVDWLCVSGYFLKRTQEKGSESSPLNNFLTAPTLLPVAQGFLLPFLTAEALRAASRSFHLLLPSCSVIQSTHPLPIPLLLLFLHLLTTTLPKLCLSSSSFGCWGNRQMALKCLAVPSPPVVRGLEGSFTKAYFCHAGWLVHLAEGRVCPLLDRSHRQL